MSKTLVILNPFAGSGRAGRVWKELEPLLWKELGELVVAITQRTEDVAQHLDKAYDAGIQRVIAIGGDGTNHTLINALAALNTQHPNDPKMIYGNLPIGSGQDWARHKKIPLDIHQAARWIANATPTPTDVGKLMLDNNQQEYFLNIASAGLSGEVNERVNNTAVRKPWTFLKATLQSLHHYEPKVMQIRLDGQDWYEGKTYLLAVANGTTFGHGMQIAPRAETNDGVFDVVLVKGVSKLVIFSALHQVYSGSHLTHPAVKYAQAKEVQITGVNGSVGLDLDGETATSHDMTFRIQPGLMQILS
ncbi:MAG: diacylglycerol kinase family lipid kinase [Anaerolineae bacterium]|nr:diacylglycerol kinase family lipid kinase [Anaerolineae bacterium]